jgi:hypothetical protein
VSHVALTSLRIALRLAAFCGVLALLGCTTADSEIPWNAPQQWEGTPGIPGLSRD